MRQSRIPFLFQSGLPISPLQLAHMSFMSFYPFLKPSFQIMQHIPILHLSLASMFDQYGGVFGDQDTDWRLMM